MEVRYRKGRYTVTEGLTFKSVGGAGSLVYVNILPVVETQKLEAKVAVSLVVAVTTFIFREVVA